MTRIVRPRMFGGTRLRLSSGPSMTTNFDVLKAEAHRRLADLGVVVLAAEQNAPGLLLHRLRADRLPRPVCAVVAAVEALTAWQHSQRSSLSRTIQRGNRRHPEIGEHKTIALLRLAEAGLLDGIPRDEWADPQRWRPWKTT
jgi:hypothetical protein